MTKKFLYYFISKNFIYLLLYIAVFIAIFIIIDLAVLIKTTKLKELVYLDLFLLSITKLPTFLLYLLPVVSLLALAHSYYKIAQNGKLDSLRTTGLSPLSLTFSILAVYLIFVSISVLIISLNSDELNSIVDQKEIEIFGVSYRVSESLNDFWVDIESEDKTLLLGFRSFDKKLKQLNNVKMLSLDKDFNFIQHLSMNSINYKNIDSKDVWITNNLNHDIKSISATDFSQIKREQTKPERLILDIPYSFEDIVEDFIPVSHLSLKEIYKKIKIYSTTEPHKVIEHQLYLGKIFVQPIYLFGIVFFVSYYFFSYNKRWNSSKAYLAISLTILLGQFFFIISRIFSALVRSGKLDILTATFAMPVLFGLTGLFFVLSLEVNLKKLLPHGLKELIANRFSSSIIFLVAILTMLSYANPVSAQEQEQNRSISNLTKLNQLGYNKSSKFDVFADNFEADLAEKKTYARGNVVATIGSIVITADQALYDHNLDKITFTGEIDIKLLDSTKQGLDLLATEVIFDRKNDVISANNILFSQGDLRVEAGSLTTSSEGNLVLLDASATFCDYCTRSDLRWRVRAKRTVFDDESKRVRFYDGVYYDINYSPVFFTHYFSVPYPGVERASGLLTPNIGYTSETSAYFYQPYFHVIDEYNDITFTPVLSVGYFASGLIEYRNFSDKHQFKFSNYLGLNYNEADNITDETNGTVIKSKPSLGSFFAINYFAQIDDHWKSRVDFYHTPDSSSPGGLQVVGFDRYIYKNRINFEGIYKQQYLNFETTAVRDLSPTNNYIEHSALPSLSYNAWQSFGVNQGYIDYNFQLDMLKVGYTNNQEIYDTNIAMYNFLSYTLPFSYNNFNTKTELFAKSALFFSDYDHTNYLKKNLDKRSETFLKASYQVGISQELSYDFLFQDENISQNIQPKAGIHSSYSNFGTLSYAELIHEDIYYDQTNLFQNSYYISNGLESRGVGAVYGLDYTIYGNDSLSKIQLFVGHSWNFYNQYSKISNNALVFEGTLVNYDWLFRFKSNLALREENPLLFFHADILYKGLSLGYRREYFPEQAGYLNQVSAGFSYDFDKLTLGINSVIAVDRLKLLDISLDVGYREDCLEFSFGFGKDFKYTDPSQGYRFNLNFQLLY